MSPDSPLSSASFDPYLFLLARSTVRVENFSTNNGKGNRHVLPGHYHDRKRRPRHPGSAHRDLHLIGAEATEQQYRHEARTNNARASCHAPNIEDDRPTPLAVRQGDNR